MKLFIQQKKGKKHILRLIRELIAFEPQGTGTDIALALTMLSKVIKRQGILIFISDFLAEPQSFAQPLRLAAKKFDLIPVIIEDRLEKALPSMHACLTVRDPETGEERFLSLASAEFNQLLALRRDVWEKQLAEIFNPLKIEGILVDTALPPADPVIEFFKRRARKIKR